MLITGMILSLSPRETARTSALSQLRERGDIELGEFAESRLPIVLESPDMGSQRADIDWIQHLDGVDHADVHISFY